MGEGVTGEAWGPGAEWALECLPSWLGLDDDPSAFATDHALIAAVHRRHLGMRFPRTGLVFDALVWAVTGQKVTGREAKSGMRGLLVRFSEPAPGPRPLQLPPDPDRLAAAPYHLFHDLGIEKRRADTLRRLASDSRRIDRLGSVAAVDARRYLERFPGVGVWTSAETVTVSHGDPDAVSVGDFHLKHQVCWHLAGEERGTDERMLELLDPFRPHRGRVTRLLETLDHYPRRGPRRPLRSFADR
jgi:3-methyladenine DNA glycosylase/8-oxoguanine DNA glycosylase